MKNILKAIYEEMGDKSFLSAVSEIMVKNKLAIMVNIEITKDGLVIVSPDKISLFRNCTFNTAFPEVFDDDR